MSSDFARPPFGGQHNHTTQNDPRQSSAGYSGDLSQYLPSQAQDYYDDIRDTVPLQNRYAFNTNAQLFNPTSQDPRPYHSQTSVTFSSQPPVQSQIHDSFPIQTLPGLRSVGPAERDTYEPLENSKKPTPTIPIQGIKDNMTGQGGSDLEEGELSEGSNYNSIRTHPSSRPESSQSLPKVNGHLAKEVSDNPHSGSSRMALRQDVLLHGNNKTTQSVTSRANRMKKRKLDRGGISPLRQSRNGLDWAGRDRTPPNKRLCNKSLKASQEGARCAVKQLHPHSIDYLQLLEEHIDSHLLMRLYSELGIVVPEPTQPYLLSGDTQLYPNSIEASRSMAAPVSTTIDLASQYIHEPQSADTQGSQERRETRVVERVMGRKSPEVRGSHSERGQAIGAVSHNSAKVNEAIQQPKTDVNGNLANHTSTNKITAQSPTTDKDKSTAAQVSHQGSTQSSTAITLNKPPNSKATVTPVDRKDYIARLLAAKAGKTLPAANASKPVSAPATQKTSQNLLVGIRDKTSRVDGFASAQAPTNNSVKKVDESPKPIDTADPKGAIAEAKKREQTELARRKIEELKKRSEALKKAPLSAHEAPAPHPTQQPPSVQKSTTLSGQTTLQSTRPLLLESASQTSYFPLQNDTFAIPGLFMSRQQAQSGPQSEHHPPDSVEELSRHTTHPNSLASSLSIGDTAPQLSVPALETSVFVSQENRIAEKAPEAGATVSKAVTNTRKRPTAIDFIEPIPSKTRRLGALRADNSVVFEVSDDEADAIVHDTSEMQPTGNQVAKSGQLEGPQMSIRQQPASGEMAARPEPGKTTPALALQAPQAPLKLKESGGLRSKEEEIARMNLKIAEMEQRRKSKQVASRAESPGTPGKVTSAAKSVDNNTNVPNVSSSIRRSSEPASQTEEGKRVLKGIQSLESSPPELSPSKQRTLKIKPVEDNVNNPAISAEKQHNNDDHHHNERAEIESRIPSINATVKNYMARLQKLQEEEADLQARIQEQIDDKRTLEEKLDKIIRAPDLAAEVPTETDGEGSGVGTMNENQPPVHASPSLVSHDKTPPLAISLSNGVHEAPQIGSLTEANRDSPELSMPETPASTKAPTDQSLASGELAEDVMDISGSEDEGMVTEDGEESHTHETPLVVGSDSDEIYEPPTSFEVIEKEPTVQAGPEERHPDDKEDLHKAPLELTQSTPMAESNVQNDMQDNVEDDPGALLVSESPGHAATHVDMSDSDDYEPPEPTTSVDIPPLSHDTPIAISNSSLSPPDANQNANQDAEAKSASPDPLAVGRSHVATQVVEMTPDDVEEAQKPDLFRGHSRFAPYESPLQRFHAYRYHPDFISRVGSGYRSLTYSHNIDARKPICIYEIGGRCNDPSCENQHFKSMNLSDDLILVQMGAVPEGLSAEQKDAFVVGLRQVIQEIRGRKVKDFKTVASEIVAYRARFLGDDFKVLPL